MTDRDKLIKSCQTCLHNNVCKFTDEELCKGTKVKDLITECKDYIANGVIVNEWRPASEPPKNDYEKHWKNRQYYLVRLAPSGLMRVAKYGYKEHDWWIDSHDCVLEKACYTKVTHWMPLPQPPKEVE